MMKQMINPLTYDPWRTRVVFPSYFWGYVFDVLKKKHEDVSLWIQVAALNALRVQFGA